jgi:hypothetical protein
MLAVGGHLFFDRVRGDRDERFHAVAKRTAAAFVICAFALAWHANPRIALFAPQELFLLRPHSRSDSFISTCFVFVVVAYTLAELTHGLSFLGFGIEIAYRQYRIEREWTSNLALVFAGCFGAGFVWYAFPYVFLFTSLVPAFVNPRWNLICIRLPFIIVAGLRSA